MTTDEGQRIARGHQAQREFKEVQAAFEEVEKALHEKLAATPITTPDVVLRLHAGIQAVEAVKKALNNVINDGVMAEHAVQQLAHTR